MRAPRNRNNVRPVVHVHIHIHKGRRRPPPKYEECGGSGFYCDGWKMYNLPCVECGGTGIKGGRKGSP